jgi:O-antigen/teichoic acid export membrane protein
MKIPRTLLIASAGWSNRIVAALVQIISIPLFIKLLGIDGYAAFLVASGLVSWFALSELGIGSVLQNEISALRVKNQTLDGVLELYLSLLIKVTLLCIIVYLPISFGLNWFFDKTFDHYRYLLLVTGVLYILFINSNVVYKIYFANHLGYIGYFYQTVANIIWFALVFLLSRFLSKDATPELLITIMLLPQILIAMFLFTRLKLDWQKVKLWPNMELIWMYISILNKSKNFFWVLVTSNFVLGIDYIFIAKLLNQHDIVTYSVINKVYLFVAFGYNVLLASLWPVLAELYASGAKGNYKKANLILIKYIVSAASYVILASLFIIALREQITSLLVKSRIEIPLELIGLFCLYYCIRVFVDFICVALQSRNQVRILMLTAPIQALVTILLMFLFVDKYALDGVMYSLILGFILTAGWTLPLAYLRGNSEC